MAKPIHEREVFVVLFDILGFKKMIETDELAKVAETYRSAKAYFDDPLRSINRLQRHSGKKDRVKYRVFSDTFLIYTTKANENCFLSLLAACDFLFMSAVEHSLPIRGSITYGKLISSDGVEIGQPIVDAHMNEQMQDWVGCWIAEECESKVDISKYITDKSIVRYEVPLKDGEVKTRLAYNWVKAVVWKAMFEGMRNDLTQEQVRAAARFASSASSDWNIRRKIDNTNKFVEFVSSPEFVEDYTSGKVS